MEIRTDNHDRTGPDADGFTLVTSKKRQKKQLEEQNKEHQQIWRGVRGYRHVPIVTDNKRFVSMDRILSKQSRQ